MRKNQSSTSSTDNDATSKFWVDTFSKTSIVDWDIFINLFSQFIQKNFKVRLEEIQKNEIKRIVDSSNQQQIKLKNFNNFIEQYWMLPINRQKLFKKHFKAIETQYQNGFKAIQFTITVKQAGKEASKISVYTFRNDSIRCNNVNHPIKNKGFVTIGSSDQADITINNINVNPTHFKIFKHPLGYKIKDISKSNRAKFRINKRLLLKPGMVLCLYKYEIQIISLRPGELPSGDFQYLNVGIRDQSPQQIDDTTITFIVKNTLNQEQKKYAFNYKKLFRFGKDPLLDCFIEDIRVKTLAAEIVYMNENWFIEPKQEMELQMATLSEVKSLSNSASLFAETGMRVQFKDTIIDLKLIKN